MSEENFHHQEELKFPLESCVNQFVIPNLGMQINPEIIKKTGVSIPLLLSAPGAGKTSVIRQKLEDYGFGSLIVHAALKPIEEFGGIPKFTNVSVNKEDLLGTVWSVSDIIIELCKLSENHPLVCLFLDDFHLCGPEHLPLFQECFTERSIRGYKLPVNTAILLAGNPSHKAGYRSLSSAIVNRCVKLPVYTKFDDWLENFARPNGIHRAITSFLNHPSYSKYFHEEEMVDEAWASPRQWTRLSNFMVEWETRMNQKMKPIDVLYYSSGHVGKDSTSHLVQYMEIYLKFDMKNIFNNSKNFKLFDDLVDRYVFVFAATNYISELLKKKDKKEEIIDQFMDILDVYLTNDGALGILFLKEITLITSIDIRIFKKIVSRFENKYPDIILNILNERIEES